MTDRKREKHPLTGKLYCGGCRYAMVYMPPREKNKYRRFECSKHALTHNLDCCTYFCADMLEELVLPMLNKELMIRGEAVRQKKNLKSLKECQLVAVKDELKDLQREQELVKDSKDGAYEEYATGSITPEEYQGKMDKLDHQMELLSGQLREWQEKCLELEDEQEKLDTDMRQIIRYTHIEELTQDLVDTFIERIYVYKDKRVEIKWKFSEG